MGQVRSGQVENLNADNAKIDGALAGLAQMAAELASTLELSLIWATVR